MGEKTRSIMNFVGFLLDRKHQQSRDFLQKLKARADRLEPVENCADGAVVWVGYAYWDKPGKLVVFRLLTDKQGAVMPGSIRYQFAENVRRLPSWSKMLRWMGVFK